MYATLTTEGVYEEHEGVPTLDEMQAIVAQGATPGHRWVEALELRHGITMWSNEEAKYAGPPCGAIICRHDGHALPRNARATFAAQEYPGLFPGDFIAGDVVFTSHDPETGETAGLNDEQLAYVRQFRQIAEIGRPGSGVWNMTGVHL